MTVSNSGRETTPVHAKFLKLAEQIKSGEVNLDEFRDTIREQRGFFVTDDGRIAPISDKLPNGFLLAPVSLLLPFDNGEIADWEVIDGLEESAQTSLQESDQELDETSVRVLFRMRYLTPGIQSDERLRMLFSYAVSRDDRAYLFYLAGDVTAEEALQMADKAEDELAEFFRASVSGYGQLQINE